VLDVLAFLLDRLPAEDFRGLLPALPEALLEQLRGLIADPHRAAPGPGDTALARGLVRGRDLLVVVPARFTLPMCSAFQGTALALALEPLITDLLAREPVSRSRRPGPTTRTGSSGPSRSWATAWWPSCSTVPSTRAGWTGRTC
jgi:hypothetical protein